MGIALGLGVLVGVRAGTVDQETLAILLVTLLAIVGLLGARAFAPFALLAALGIVAGTLAADLRQADSEAPLATDEPGPFTGRIVSDPRVIGRGSIARFEWRDGQGARRESLLFLPGGSDVGHDDRVEVSGDLDGTYGERIYGAEVRIVERAGRIESTRQDIRDELTRRIQRAAPGSPGTLALGILIGDDSALTETERDALRASGLSHITAVSGWNVTVVIGFVALTLRTLGRTGPAWIALQLVGIVVFVWIVGAEPPIVRAAIMGSLALVALALGRPAHLLTLLVLSAAVMAAHDPSILGSLSFQLSFLATVGLVVAARIVERSESWAGRLVGLLSAPTGTALATIPLLAARFGTLSLATVPANLLVQPLVPLAALLAAIAALVADIPLLGLTAGTALWLVCSSILEIARQFASAPGAHWTFAPFSPAATAGLYLFMAVAAAPAVPECRAGIRELVYWAEDTPGIAAATAVSVIFGMIGIALVLMAN